MPKQPGTESGSEPGPGHEKDRAELMEDLVQALQLFTVESDVFVDVFARAHDLGRSDLNAIMWIARGMQEGQPPTAGELATRLGLGAPATTALVDRLEAAGHVRRSRDPGDRRKVTIEMEAPALQLAREFFEPLGRRMEAAMAGHSADDLAVAAAVVSRLREAVIEERQA